MICSYLLGMLSQFALSQAFAIKVTLAGVAASSAVVMLVYLVAFCISMPIIYKLGIENARYVLIGAMMLPFFGVLLGSNMVAQFLSQLTQFQTGLTIFAGVFLVVLIFCVSMHISTKIFTKKEL
jgi:hypothetical protein